MHLIQLNEDDMVIAVKSMGDMPLLTRLDDSYMVAVNPPAVGQYFNSTTQAFMASVRKRWLTKLAFDSRFTMPEAVALKLAQSYPARQAEESDAAYTTRCAIPAQLQVMASRLSMASYIDLDRADTINGVMALEQLGLLAAGRANEILTGPIASHEFHPDA